MRYPEKIVTYPDHPAPGQTFPTPWTIREAQMKPFYDELAKREAEEKAKMAAAQRAGRAKWRAESAPKDARGVPVLSTSPVILNPENSAYLDPVKLRKAKHYKTLEELENAMDAIKDGCSDEYATIEDTVAELRASINEETKAKEAAILAGEIQRFKDCNHAIELLTDEIRANENYMRVLDKRAWLKVGPEEVTAMYESLCEITSPEIIDLDAKIRELTNELEATRYKKLCLIEERENLWRTFYRNVLKEPEIYWAEPMEDEGNLVIHKLETIHHPYYTQEYNSLKDFEHLEKQPE